MFDQVPVPQVSTPPTMVSPVTTGATLTTGAPDVIAFAAVVDAVPAPCVLEAVTVQVRLVPSSSTTGV